MVSLPSSDTFTYDGNGNQTKRNSFTLQYDPENRWTKFLTTGGATFFSAGYTPDNLRAWKEKDGTRTYYLYDGTLPVVELDATGAIWATNTFGAMGLVSRNAPNNGVHTNRFYTFDERGNVTQRYDETRTLRQSYIISAFGDTVRFPSSSPNDPFTFGAQFGYMADPETGLVYCVNRYYDRTTARWLTRDPISYDGGINLYAYVGNNPITRIDPLGLAWIAISWEAGRGY